MGTFQADPGVSVHSTFDAEMASVSIWPFICWNAFFIVVIVLTSWGLFRQWRRWKGKDEGSFDRPRTVVLAAILCVAILVPGSIYVTSAWERHVEESKPDLTYYTYADRENESVAWLGMYRMDDVDSVLFEDRAIVFIVEDDRTFLQLSSWEPGQSTAPTEPVHMVTIGSSEPPINARGTVTAVVEDQMISVYYSYIVRTEAGTETHSWRLDSTDGIEWPTPVPVDGEPEDDQGDREIPKRFDWYRGIDVYDHRMVRTSSGDDLLVVQYYRDEICYPDHKGTYFAYRPRGEGWSDLVRIGNVHDMPMDVHGLSDGTFLVITTQVMSGGRYQVYSYRFGPDAFEDPNGPFAL
jgi:hypothetical protein